ncbi:MAG TPA: PQQ-binding-like beta-propeller repeat protein [Planctomycetota bacterium]|nr:PQQ-binding-like beta-propeller repeat protein [Planctomycetota bacterium]
MRLTVKTGLLGLTLLAGGCLSTQNRHPIETPKPSTTEAISGGGRRDRPQPIEDDRLKSFGLELFWDSWIRDESISKLQLEANTVTGEGNLYAYTDSNRLYQIDLHSGKVNWVFDVGQPLAFADRERPICEFNYEKDETFKRYDEVFFVAKDTLYALDKTDGSELWRLTCKFGVSSPPQATQTHVLLGSYDERVYAIQKSDPSTYDWMYRTDAPVTARPGYLGVQSFVCSTDGTLYTFKTASGEIISKQRTEKRLTADPLVYKNLLYVGGEDFNLYVWGALDGFPHFRYPAGSPITKTPVAIANRNDQGKQTATIYIKTEGPEGGIVAILRGGKVSQSQRFSHEFLWKRDGAEQVVARGRDVVYLLEPGSKDDPTRTKRLVKVDAKSCYLRDEVKMSGVDYYITNPLDPNDKKANERKEILGGIVLCGWRNGWIMAFKEKSPYPTD